MKSSARNLSFEPLNGARAVAAVYVLLEHFGASIIPAAREWIELGMATSFFFVLSSFVLAIAYGPKLRSREVSGVRFALLRVGRLYPLYIISFAILVPLALVPRWCSSVGLWSFDTPAKFKLMTGVAQASMAHVFSPRLTLWWNVPGWFVCTDIWLCFLIPFAAPRLLALSTRRLWAALIALYVCSVAISVGIFVLKPDGASTAFAGTGYWTTMYKYSPLSRWPEFLCGAALGALWLRVPPEKRNGGTLWMVVPAVALCSLLFFAHRLPQVLLHNGVLLPLYAALIWGIGMQGSALHRLFSWRPLVAVGESSYALYLVQFPLMYWLMLAAGQTDRDHLPPLFTCVSIVVIVALSIALHFLVEVPLQKRTREWVDSLPLTRVAEPEHGALPARL